MDSSMKILNISPHQEAQSCANVYSVRSGTMTSRHAHQNGEFKVVEHTDVGLEVNELELSCAAGGNVK